MFEFLKRKKKFDQIDNEGYWKIENQNGYEEAESDDIVFNYFYEMVEDPDQFITLQSPFNINNVSFIQAATVGEEELIDVQLGINEKGHTVLYSYKCDVETAKNYIMSFYAGKLIPDFKLFKPMKF